MIRGEKWITNGLHEYGRWFGLLMKASVWFVLVEYIAKVDVKNFLHKIQDDETGFCFQEGFIGGG